LNITLVQWSQSSSTWKATFDILNNGIGKMGPQTVNLYYNTDIFDVEATIDDIVFDINCKTTSSC